MHWKVTIPGQVYAQVAVHAPVGVHARDSRGMLFSNIDVFFFSPSKIKNPKTNTVASYRHQISNSYVISKFLSCGPGS